ncbi:MAG: hypothetical protein KDC66_22870 [Phaeodactylibacter sp.]|nr:hypothetical protein [Phaeodactylibacter sp.]MCB9275816.1 hypothetical protein [Lewinellaceae bacterium]
MLICNNCFTLNEDGTERCVHCNMKGHFTHRDETGWAGDPLETPQVVVSCQNCGSSTPGDGAKCVECHFPLPARRPGGEAGASWQATEGFTSKAKLHVKEKS